MMLVVAAAAFLIFLVLQSGQQSQGMGKPAVFGALSLRKIYYTTFVYNSFLFIKQGHNYRNPWLREMMEMIVCLRDVEQVQAFLIHFRCDAKRLVVSSLNRE